MTTQPIELSQENKRGSQSIQIGQQKQLLWYGLSKYQSPLLRFDKK